MTEFYQQYFCPDNESYSVIIEDDGKVAYAYLLEGDSIVGDVWLYNQQKAPERIDFKDRENMPFLNPQGYLNKEKVVQPIQNTSEVLIEWFYEGEIIKVELFLRNELLAILKHGSLPGWSVLVKKDGPLAKKMINNEIRS